MRTRIPRSERAAYGAAAWSLVFLVPHAYWAAGGTAGLDGRQLDGAVAVVNAAAIALSLLAAALALALVRRWGAAVPWWALLAGAWAACALLGLRGAGGLVQGLFGGSSLFVASFEALFLLGGVLFGVAARQYARAVCWSAPKVGSRYRRRTTSTEER